MTVAQLTQALDAYPPEMLVVLDDWADGAALPTMHLAVHQRRAVLVVGTGGVRRVVDVVMLTEETTSGLK